MIVGLEFELEGSLIAEEEGLELEVEVEVDCFDLGLTCLKAVALV